MEDKSVPPMPNEGGDNKATDKKTGEKRAEKSQKNFIAANRNKRAKSEPTLTLAGLFVVLIEVAGLVMWQLADIFHNWMSGLIHWLSLDCFVAGAAIAAHKVLKHPKWVWILYAGICVIIGFVVIENFNEAATPKPPQEVKPKYEIFSGDEGSQIVQLLRASSSKPMVLIYLVDPDDSAFTISSQIESMFSIGGFHVGEISGEPPDVFEKPDVSFFVYNFVPDVNLMQAMDRIGNHCGNRGFTIMKGGFGNFPKTNAVILVIVRRK